MVVVLLLAAMLLCLENSKINIRPFYHNLRPQALRLSTPIAIGSGRTGCGGLPFPLRTGGGAMRPCHLIVILAAWLILPVLL